MHRTKITMEITLLAQNTEADFEEIIRRLKEPVKYLNQHRQAKIEKLEAELIINHDFLEEPDEENFSCTCQKKDNNS